MSTYDPLEYDNLARSVVQALLDNPEEVLPPGEAFAGAGVYAIYYHGKFPPYAPLATIDPSPPIYVGKAVPAGARKGAKQQEQGAQLIKRLNEHAKSIGQATNLKLTDFSCRYLVVVPVWIAPAERFLIEHYRPIWNLVVDGFGNHAPGKGRRAMKRPQWDILHPGRPWAAELEPAETSEEVSQKVLDFLNSANKKP